MLILLIGKSFHISKVFVSIITYCVNERPYHLKMKVRWGSEKLHQTAFWFSFFKLTVYLRTRAKNKTVSLSSDLGVVMVHCKHIDVSDTHVLKGCRQISSPRKWRRSSEPGQSSLTRIGHVFHLSDSVSNFNCLWASEWIHTWTKCSYTSLNASFGFREKNRTVSPLSNRCKVGQTNLTSP